MLNIEVRNLVDLLKCLSEATSTIRQSSIVIRHSRFHISLRASGETQSKGY